MFVGYMVLRLVPGDAATKFKYLRRMVSCQVGDITELSVTGGSVFGKEKIDAIGNFGDVTWPVCRQSI